MSRVIANAYRHTAASADAITLDSSGNVTFPANATCSGTASGFGGGKVLQVVSFEKTTAASTANQSARVDIPSMSLAITPSASNSKILIHSDLNIGMPSGGYHINLHLMRDSTDIAEGTGSAGSGYSNAVNCTASTYNFGNFGNEPIHTTVLDSPNTTNQTTYKWQWHIPNYNNQEMYLNRNHSQQDYAYNTWKSSRIILMEIGA